MLQEEIKKKNLINSIKVYTEIQQNEITNITIGDSNQQLDS